MRWIKLVSLFIVATFLVWSCNLSEEVGLSSSDSREACEYKVNYALDKGNYDEVIEMLDEGGECYGALDKKSRDLNLAAAYLGRAGFTIPSLVDDILSSGEEESGSTRKNDAYSRFLSAISDRANGDALKALKKALKYYKDALGKEVNCSNASAITDPILKDICFLKGITQVATAGTSFALLFESVSGGEEEEGGSIKDMVDFWTSSEEKEEGTCDNRDINNNNNPDPADFSACAMDFAINGKLTATANSTCDNASIVPGASNCNFGFDNKTFYVLKLTINPKSPCTENDTIKTKTSYKVIEVRDEGNFTVITQGYGYCNNGTKCDPKKDKDCYPKPLILDEEKGETATQVGMIVETLNQGTEAIANMVGAQGEGEQTELEQQVNDFKRDFCEKKSWTVCVLL
jgi:hypothetical protein